MSWLLDALFHATFLWIPTWVYAVAIVAGVIIVYRVFGWQATLAAAVAGLVFLATAFGAQKGARDEKAKQERADQKARDTITKTRTDVSDDTDADLDKRFRKWER